MPGPPIRTPSDHSPPAGSPRLIAGHHVLHRPLMPRHPPNAQKNKHTTQPKRTRPQSQHKEQRYSRPLYRSQPTRPHTPDQPPEQKRDQPDAQDHNQGAPPQNPTACPPPPTPPHRRRGESGDRRPRPPGHPGGTRTRSSCSQPKQPHRTRPDHPHPPTQARGGRQGGTPNHAQQNKELPRKEVIQPHLPVRLPCYDFVPITSPTFDRSP